ncbi:MAG: PAS domain-containing protein, partial [Eudoraea sp.]|nr:PAS domain-containing protein [Eudoraea sp.]
TNEVSSWAELVLPEDLEIVMPIFQDCISDPEKDTINIEYRVKRPDNDIVFISASGYFLRNDKGEPMWLSGIHQDITEYREKEEFIKDANYRLEMAAEYTGIGTWDWNAKLDKTIGNKVWKSLFGFDSNYGVFDSWVENIHRDDLDYVMKNFTAHMSGESELYQAEFRYNHPDRGWIWIKSTGKLIEWDKNNEPLRMLGTSTETTEYKKIEQEIKNSNNELERFAYVASHDLQEPLRKIRGYGELLEKTYADLLDDKAGRFIGVITGAATRMQTLTDDLLVLSRLSTRPQEFEEVDLGLVIEEVKENLEIKIREENASIKGNVDAVIVADRGQIVQLFQNLISNAIKFRGDDDPLVEISLEKNRSFIQVNIKDNGIGLDMAYAEKVFETFQRLHTAKEYKGTGIGLSICKKIVERHGGMIWVESEPRKGSVFSIKLPLKK